MIRIFSEKDTTVIYLVKHLKLNVNRVIKAIRKDHPQYVYLAQEAHVLKHLTHPSIPSIFDLEEDESYLYLVEEYLEGVSLKEYMDKMKLCPYDLIIQYAIQICNVIQYLHTLSTPIYYLDLKPTNLMVVNNRIKLIDFGAARMGYNSKQIVYGTVHYAAPEQINEGIIDERCDIYGIGMVLFYLLTGEHYKETDAGLVLRYKHNNIKKLERLIRKCLQQKPNHRYSSVEQLRIQLEALQCNCNQTIKSEIQTIAIAGIKHGIGTTHTALYVNAILNCSHQKSVYVEEDNCYVTCAMENRTNEQRKCSIFQTGSCLIDKEKKDIQHLIQWKVTYVIKDCGVLNDENKEKWLSADISCLVIGSKPWELEALKKHIVKLCGYDRIFYLLNFSQKEDYIKLRGILRERPLLSIPYTQNPCCPMYDQLANDFLSKLLI